MLENKPVREIGMILSKSFTKAREAGVSFDGSRKWEAKPEEYYFDVISCDKEDFDKITGIPNGVRLTYNVDKETYEKAKFGDWVQVKYILVSKYVDGKNSGQLVPKAESCVLVNKDK